MEFYFAGAAALGAILLGVLGWCKTPEGFEAKKFLATVITGIIAGAGVGVTFAGVPFSALYLILAFLTGAGVDYTRNTVSGAIAARANGTQPKIPK